MTLHSSWGSWNMLTKFEISGSVLPEGEIILSMYFLCFIFMLIHKSHGFDPPPGQRMKISCWYTRLCPMQSRVPTKINFLDKIGWLKTKNLALSIFIFDWNQKFDKTNNDQFFEVQSWILNIQFEKWLRKESGSWMWNYSRCSKSQ